MIDPARIAGLHEHKRELHANAGVPDWRWDCAALKQEPRREAGVLCASSGSLVADYSCIESLFWESPPAAGAGVAGGVSEFQMSWMMSHLPSFFSYTVTYLPVSTVAPDLSVTVKVFHSQPRSPE